MRRRRIAAASVPRRYLDHCTLETFYEKNNASLMSAKRKVREFVDAWPMTQNGRWLLRPGDAEAQVTQRYRDETLIVETDFVTGAGAVRLIDFMPIRDGAPALIRTVAGLRGTVAMQMHLRLRFGYGAVPPWIELDERRGRSDYLPAR